MKLRIEDLHVAVVVNTAAYTQVDAAETDEATAFRINVTTGGDREDVCSLVTFPLAHYGAGYHYGAG